jgi:predicted site-specific integrase-resolvase
MKEFCKKVGLSRMTVLKLEKEGVITPLKTPSGHRRFTDEHVRQVFEYKIGKVPNTKKTVIYCRVSTKKQEEFLNNQIEACKQFCYANGYTVDDIIVDVASSFNFARKGLSKLLDMVIKSEIGRVIIYDKDRLSRIAFDLFKNLFGKFGVEIIVLNSAITDSDIDEITSELVSFIHYITSKIYGRRCYIKFKEKLCRGEVKDEANSKNRN